MKNIIFIVIAVFSIQLVKAQDVFFKVEHFGIYIPNKNITLSFPNLKKKDIEDKILKFIKEKKFVYKPFLSSDSRIAFRDFSFVCRKEKCKADIIAKNFFFIDYADGFAKISFENEIYSTISDAKLLINNNDDVASENDVPFGVYEFSAPYKYEEIYQESVFAYNKAGKPTLQNPENLKTILEFYKRYVLDLKTYLEN